MPSVNGSPDKPQPGRTEPALRDYLAAIALIAVVGGLALVLLGCQTSRVLSAVSQPI